MQAAHCICATIGHVCLTPCCLPAQSDLAYKRRDYGLVITELGKLLKLDSGNIAALIMRGWAYLQTGALLPIAAAQYTP